MAPSGPAKPACDPKLSPITPRKHPISHLGCLHACIDRLGAEVDTAWLYGVTGYAFLLNVYRGVMCAGPTAWDWHSIKERTPDIGIDTSAFIRSDTKQPGFEQR